MTTLVLQHAFQGLSGLPEDRYVNTLHVTTLTPILDTDFAAIRVAVTKFYNPTAGQGIRNYMSAQVCGVGRSFKVYDLEDEKPRAPVYEVVDVVAPFSQPGVQSLPGEVAVCMSYEGSKISGQPQARRRGRIFLGPLNTTAMTSSITAPPRPEPAFMAIINTAAFNLKADLFAAGAAWVVYSPTNDSTGQGSPESVCNVINSWCDDAFDTQRRRGPAPTTKLANPMA